MLLLFIRDKEEIFFYSEDGEVLAQAGWGFGQRGLVRRGPGPWQRVGLDDFWRSTPTQTNLRMFGITKPSHGTYKRAFANELLVYNSSWAPLMDKDRCYQAIQSRNCLSQVFSIFHPLVLSMNAFVQCTFCASKCKISSLRECPRVLLYQSSPSAPHSHPALCWFGGWTNYICVVAVCHWAKLSTDLVLWCTSMGSLGMDITYGTGTGGVPRAVPWGWRLSSLKLPQDTPRRYDQWGLLMGM